MDLRIPCYCDPCLNSSALRVGVKTLLNTIQTIVQNFRAQTKYFFVFVNYRIVYWYFLVLDTDIGKNAIEESTQNVLFSCGHPHKNNNDNVYD